MTVLTRFSLIGRGGSTFAGFLLPVDRLSATAYLLTRETERHDHSARRPAFVNRDQKRCGD